MRVAQFTSFFLFFASNLAYSLTFNLTEGVTPVSHDIYNLHMTMLGVCFFIGLIVFGAMTYAIIFNRKSQGVIPANFHTKRWLEITWTIVPFLILGLTAIPGTRVLINMNNYDVSELTIKITGSQWKWQYEYLDSDVHFISNIATPYAERIGKQPKNPNYLREVDHPLIVPIHRKIRFLVTSSDVMHSWWVPDLGIKREAIPGFINETWARIDRPGIYYGQCTELCGINHAFMPIVVQAISEKGFDDWIAQQKGGLSITPVKPSTIVTPSTPVVTPAANPAVPNAEKQFTKEELMQHGEQIFQNICAACHKPDGSGMPPVFPALKGSKIVTGPLPGHLNRVMNGKPGTAMQAFKEQLSDEDIASVITYERNSFGNNTGDIVQPSIVKAARAEGAPTQ